MRIKENLKMEMKQAIERMKGYTGFRKFATKVENGFKFWFTCIIKLFVEPTNNIAKRALRELIVQRKIIGGLRREKGARIMEVITTIIASSKMKDLPVFETVRSYL